METKPSNAIELSVVYQNMYYYCHNKCTLLNLTANSSTTFKRGLYLYIQENRVEGLKFQ